MQVRVSWMRSFDGIGGKTRFNTWEIRLRSEPNIDVCWTVTTDFYLADWGTSGQHWRFVGEGSQLILEDTRVFFLLSGNFDAPWQLWSAWSRNEMIN